MAEDDGEGADDEQFAEVAPVEYGTGEEPDEEDHVGLDAADPGDVGGGFAEEGAGFVVGLVDAEGVEDAPGVEEEGEDAEDVEPGAKAAIGRGWRFEGDWMWWF